MDIPISRLPTEMFLKVFSYLSPSDRLECCLVCKQWHEIISEYGLKSLHITLPVADGAGLLKCLQTTKLRVDFLRITAAFQSQLDEELLREIGKTARRLKLDTLKSRPGLLFEQISNPSQEENYVLKLLSLLPNVEEFQCATTPHMESQDAWPDLSRITRLVILTNVWADFTQFQRFTELLPSLRHLGVHSIGITSYKDLLKTFKNCVSSVTSLDLESCRTNNPTLLIESLTGLEGLRLQELTINIGFVEPRIILAFFRKQPAIRRLRISSTTEVSPQVVSEIVTSLPALQDLSVNISEIVVKVEESLANLFAFPHLSSVSFKQLCMFESPKLVPFVFQKLPLAPNLRHFELTYFPACTIPNMSELCRAMTGLRSLKLPSAQITDFELRVIFRNLRGLRELDLFRCQRITNDGLLGTYEDPSLDWSDSKEPRLKRPRESGSSLRDLKGLQTLNLGLCALVTVRSLFEEDLGLLDLRELSVSCSSEWELPLKSANFQRLERLYFQVESPGEEEDKNLVASTIKSQLPRLKEIKSMFQRS